MILFVYRNGDIMTNLEIMEKGCYYTKTAYMNAYHDKLSSADLDAQSVSYSAQSLYKVLESPDGICNDYTRQGNLRYDMAGLGKDSIKNELLKNIVNVAVYQRLNDTRAGNELGGVIRPGMSSDQIAVVVMNAMVNDGVEKGYEMLNDPNVLFSACQSFAQYRRPGLDHIMDNIAVTNQAAMYMNNELDTYYARYGDRPMGIDVSSLDSYGYDANGGFSGFARKQLKIKNKCDILNLVKANAKDVIRTISNRESLIGEKRISKI